MLLLSCIVQDRETVVLPRRPDAQSAAHMTKLSVKKVLEFDSELLRSGMVVVSSEAPDGSGLLFLRGAPDVIRSLVSPATVPPDFDQVSSQMTKGSAASLNVKALPVLSLQCDANSAESCYCIVGPVLNTVGLSGVWLADCDSKLSNVRC